MKVKLKFYSKNEEKYIGEIENGKPHGTGLKLAKNGDVLFGQWYNGELSGKGYFEDKKNQKRTVGEFIKGKIEGIAQTTNNEAGFLGEHSQGQKFGWGAYINKNSPNEILAGVYNGDKIQGYGKVINFDKNSIIKGFFLNGKLEGLGYIKEEDEEFLGNFSQNKKKGIGLFHYQDSVFKIGNWNKYCIKGFGIELLANGDTYEGEFNQNLKSGIGRHYQKEEDIIYTGEITDGKKNGFGRVESKILICVGDWENDVLNGWGFISESADMSYFGTWKEGVKDGIGIEKGSGYSYRGYFNNGNPHGLGYVSMKGRPEKLAIFDQGKLVRFKSSPDAKFLARLDQLDSDSYTKKSKKKLIEIDNYIENSLKNLNRSLEKQEVDLYHQEKSSGEHFNRIFENYSQTIQKLKDEYQKLRLIINETYKQNIQNFGLDQLEDGEELQLLTELDKNYQNLSEFSEMESFINEESFEELMGPKDKRIIGKEEFSIIASSKKFADEYRKLEEEENLIVKEKAALLKETKKLENDLLVLENEEEELLDAEDEIKELELEFKKLSELEEQQNLSNNKIKEKIDIAQKEEEIVKSKNEINSLKEEVDSIERNALEKISENQKLEEEISILSQKNLEAGKSLSKEESEVFEKKSELVRALATIQEEKEKKQQELKIEKKKMLKPIENSNIKKEALNIRLPNYEERLENLNTKRANLSNLVDTNQQSKKHADKLNLEIEKLDKKSFELNNKIKLAEKSFIKEKKILASKKKKLQEQQEQKNSLEESLKTENPKLKLAKEKIMILQQEELELTNKEKNQDIELKNLRNQAKDAQTNLREKKKTHKGSPETLRSINKSNRPGKGYSWESKQKFKKTRSKFIKNS